MEQKNFTTKARKKGKARKDHYYLSAFRFFRAFVVKIFVVKLEQKNFTTKARKKGKTRKDHYDFRAFRFFRAFVVKIFVVKKRSIQ
ncbi:MAG: hypothetical protein BWK80_20145 [Desulfobacteraceae bacterium IS3]|nr:MAG: hypothetical protein BWK80_20145 [Desulfobacteraceae bacterium IS3]